MVTTDKNKGDVEIMNVENNQRYRDTEKRIQQAYWNLVNRTGGHKITVADICREANIHRTTFYGHFLDIYDLQEQAMKTQFMLFLQGFFNEDGNWSFREGMRKQIDFYYRNRKIIKRHLEMIEKQERHESTFEFEMDSRMMNTYQKIFQLKNEKEVFYHQKFFHTGLEAVVRQWIRGGCEEPAEEITDLLCRIFGM